MKTPSIFLLLGALEVMLRRPDDPPMYDIGPFNPEFRPGFGEALDKEYTAWSEANPNHTREEGMKAHREISARLMEKFPTWK
jgi:hypothetical protein